MRVHRGADGVYRYTTLLCSIIQLREKIESVMEEKGYEFGKQTKKIKTRAKKIVSRGFHGAGRIV